MATPNTQTTLLEISSALERSLEFQASLGDTLPDAIEAISRLQITIGKSVFDADVRAQIMSNMRSGENILIMNMLLQLSHVVALLAAENLRDKRIASEFQLNLEESRKRCEKLQRQLDKFSAITLQRQRELNERKASLDY